MLNMWLRPIVAAFLVVSLLTTQIAVAAVSENRQKNNVLQLEFPRIDDSTVPKPTPQKKRVVKKQSSNAKKATFNTTKTSNAFYKKKIQKKVLLKPRIRQKQKLQKRVDRQKAKKVVKIPKSRKVPLNANQVQIKQPIQVKTTSVNKEQLETSNQEVQTQETEPEPQQTQAGMQGASQLTSVSYESTTEVNEKPSDENVLDEQQVEESPQQSEPETEVVGQVLEQNVEVNEYPAVAVESSVVEAIADQNVGSETEQIAQTTQDQQISETDSTKEKSTEGVDPRGVVTDSSTGLAIEGASIEAKQNDVVIGQDV